MKFFKKMFGKTNNDKEIRRFSCGTVYADKNISLDAIDREIGNYELWNGKTIKDKQFIDSKLSDRVWFLENKIKKLELSKESFESLKSLSRDTVENYESEIKKLREEISCLRGMRIKMARWMGESERRENSLKISLAKSDREKSCQLQVNKNLLEKICHYRKRLATVTGRLGASAKKAKKATSACEINKQFLGRFYWLGLQYCTIQPQPIL